VFLPNLPARVRALNFRACFDNINLLLEQHSRFPHLTLPNWHQKKGVKKICFSSLKNEIHILSIGFILSAEVILSPVIYCCCDYFILV